MQNVCVKHLREMSVEATIRTLCTTVPTASPQTPTSHWETYFRGFPALSPPRNSYQTRECLAGVTHTDLSLRQNLDTKCDKLSYTVKQNNDRKHQKESLGSCISLCCAVPSGVCLQFIGLRTKWTVIKTWGGHCSGVVHSKNDFSPVIMARVWFLREKGTVIESDWLIEMKVTRCTCLGHQALQGVVRRCILRNQDLRTRTRTP